MMALRISAGRVRLQTLATILITLLFPVVLVAAQQHSIKIYRIGVLATIVPKALSESMRELGYIEGQNLVIEQRYAAGAYDQLRHLAMELVLSKVDVIVVDGTAAAKACKDAANTIPIVFTLAVDPVADGLAASVAHPGGGLTGLTMATGYELAGKRLELLKDMVAGLSRVAVLSNPNNPPHVHYLRETERVATALGLKLHAF